MPSVIWTPVALENLNQKYAFLCQKDREIAKKMAKTVKDYAKKLELSPEMGRQNHDLEPEHRELLIPFGASGYILLYSIINNTVLVLAFRHQKEVGY